MTTTGAPIDERAWTSGGTHTPPNGGGEPVVQDEPVAEEPFERVAREEDANIENVVDKDAAESGDLEQGKNGRASLERTNSSWTSTTGASEPSEKDVRLAKRSWSEKINPLKKKNVPRIPDERAVCPEYKATFFSRLTFQWMAPLMSVCRLFLPSSLLNFLTFSRSVISVLWN